MFGAHRLRSWPRSRIQDDTTIALPTPRGTQLAACQFERGRGLAACALPLALCLALSLLGAGGCVKPPAGYPGPARPDIELEAPVRTADEPEQTDLDAETAEQAAPSPEEEADDLLAPPEESAPETAAEQDETGPTDAPDQLATTPDQPSQPAPEAGWEGVVGRSTPPGEVSKPRRATRPTRRQSPKPRARPAPAAAKPPADDASWRTVKQLDWGKDGEYPWASDVDSTTNVLDRFSNRQLSIMVNEIYARRGKRFASAWWQRYFDRQSWYYPNSQYSDSLLSPTERANAARIRSYQKTRFGRAWTP